MITSIRTLQEREPLQPFRLPSSRGVGYDVPRPDRIVILRSRIFMADRHAVPSAPVPFPHSAGVELIANGHPRRRRRPRRGS